jgi:hypothetical protein
MVEAIGEALERWERGAVGRRVASAEAKR